MIELHRKLLGDRERNQTFYDALKRVIVPGQTTVADIGRILLMATGIGLVCAGMTIMTVGMTVVFVPTDLAFMGMSAEELRAMGMLDMATYTQLQAADAMRDAARNPSGGAGLTAGIGAGIGIGNIMGQALQGVVSPDLGDRGRCIVDQARDVGNLLPPDLGNVAFGGLDFVNHARVGSDDA